MDIVTINGIPCFSAVMGGEDDRMVRVSLVDYPAVLTNWQAFAETKRQLYAVLDESRHLVRGVLMRADFPIYRRDEGGEYYVIYKPETIRAMAQKYLAEGRTSLVDTMHNGEDESECEMVQFFIKGDGVQVEGFEDCADGSLFAEYHITNEEVWQKVLDGTFRGFSIEGYWHLEPEQKAEEVTKAVKASKGIFQALNMSKVKKISAAIMAALAEEFKFGSMTTDKGVIMWDGEDAVAVGTEVFVEEAEDITAPPEDGEYTTSEGVVYVIEKGVVTEIREPEAEVAEPAAEEATEVEAAEDEPAEEASAAEEVPAPEVTEEEVNEVERKLTELEQRVTALEEVIATLSLANESFRRDLDEVRNAPAAEAAHAEFKKATKADKGDEAASALMAIVKAGNR